MCCAASLQACLGSLRFSFLNHRRACMLALAHVQGQPLPGEHMILWSVGWRPTAR